tara:strand:+ start:186 stop:686 length:501 start_codon:yes stop_codon:yes gene_type:complete
MARTSKSRGAVPFKMRSGNRPSPNKFLGGLVKSAGNFLAGGGVAGMGVRALSGGDPFQGMRPGGGGVGAAQGVMAKFMRGPQGPTVGGGRGGPMVKREAPYKRIACAKRSPMKAADATLIKAYSDAMTGNDQIVKTIKGKTKSITNIGTSLGEIFAKKSKRGSTRK